MILRAFKDKFIRLAREEDGVALVVTLAVFFFIYLICMGVYAVGTNVHERIHLQNACDAAAYSAAVVQADTLSRIATINRAMSWTYVQMTRRQMDYIVSRWLHHSVSHYRADNVTRIAWCALGTLCPLHTGSDISRIRLNGSHDVTDGEIESVVNEFKLSHLPAQHLSFYSQTASEAGLERQIADDKDAIAKMNDVEDSLIGNLEERVKTSVREILKANLDGVSVGDCYCHIEQTSPYDYTRVLRNDLDDETLFLHFADYQGPSVTFDTGIDDWFERGNGLISTPFMEGIQRAYLRYPVHAGNLCATWTWWSTKSICVPTEAGWVCEPPGLPATACGHILASPVCVADDNCKFLRTEMDTKIKRIMQANVHGNILALWNDQYAGENAKPRVLKPEYAKGEGVISICLARKNRNPFSRILNGLVEVDGVFAAFNPFVEWTFAVASAKAGYRKFEEDKTEGRDYRIDWDDEKNWNLYTGDWDAVLIPVRMAKSTAASGSWTQGNTGFLTDWVNGDWQPLGGGGDSVSTQLLAGGTRSQEGDWQVLRNESTPDRQWWNWKTPLAHQTNAGTGNRVDVEWQVGESGRGQNVKWGSLTERIFH